MDRSNPTFAEVWDTLSSVDVSQHIEKKGGLSYLSWMWAWTYLMTHFPNATFRWAHDTDHEYSPNTYYEGVKFFHDGTCEVSVEIQIGRHVRRAMWLPVMDNRNNAIKNPNARQISDTKMRCLVKCIALLGLGSYIFAGEDLPMDPKADAEREQAMVKLRAAGREYVQSFGKLPAGILKEVDAAKNSGDPATLLAAAEKITNLTTTKKNEEKKDG